MNRDTDMRIDLHSHSTISDGKLTPDELVQQAIAAGVDVLSITDHDSVEAYRHINPGQSAPLRLIPGIEFSSQWQKIEIHILGLNIDPENDILRSGIALQQQCRHDRASRIADRLARLLDIANPINAVSTIAGNNNIGRPHFARYLVETGVVKDSREAFRKYLGTGKLAWVKSQWTEPVEIIRWIRAAGGIAVLAHPGKYNLTRTKLVKLIDAFIEAGGRGLEVITGNQQSSHCTDLAMICRQKNLLASCGSDFHSMEQHWARLGNFPALPTGCTPVWHDWDALTAGLTTAKSVN